MDHDLILVTDLETVDDSNDFYLSDDWMNGDYNKEQMDEARKLQKEGKLYVGYIVRALSYAIYYQMDADKVFINEDMEVVLNCESAVINNDHKKRIEYSY